MAAVCFVALAAVCAAADLRGAGATILFFGGVLGASMHSRPTYALLTAFTAWAVHTGFVTGQYGDLGLSDGRWQELALFLAVAVVTCRAHRQTRRVRR